MLGVGSNNYGTYKGSESKKKGFRTTSFITLTPTRKNRSLSLMESAPPNFEELTVEQTTNNPLTAPLPAKNHIGSASATSSAVKQFGYNNSNTEEPKKTGKDKLMSIMGMQNTVELSTAIENSSKSKSRTKLMQVMGLNDENLSIAEEEIAVKISGSRDKVKRSSRNRKQKRIKDMKSLTSNIFRTHKRTQPSPRINVSTKFALEYLQNHPKITKSTGDDEEIRLEDVFESFRRQKTNLATINVKETIGNDNKTNTMQQSTKLSAAPLGLGLLHAEFDRWWQKLKCSGDAFMIGCFFHSHHQDICDYLIQCGEVVNIRKKLSLQIIQKITSTSNFKALSQLTGIPVFNGNHVVDVSAGFSSFALVSNIGEVYIKSSPDLFNCCFGYADGPINNNLPSWWEGNIFLEKILGRRVIQISCGAFHYAVITDTEEVITWGSNQVLHNDKTSISAQLGHNDAVFSTPKIVTGLKGGNFFFPIFYFYYF